MAKIKIYVAEPLKKGIWCKKINKRPEFCFWDTCREKCNDYKQKKVIQKEFVLFVKKYMSCQPPIKKFWDPHWRKGHRIFLGFDQKYVIRQPPIKKFVIAIAEKVENLCYTLYILLMYIYIYSIMYTFNFRTLFLFKQSFVLCRYYL